VYEVVLFPDAYDRYGGLVFRRVPCASPGASSRMGRSRRDARSVEEVTGDYDSDLVIVTKSNAS